MARTDTTHNFAHVCNVYPHRTQRQHFVVDTLHGHTVDEVQTRNSRSKFLHWMKSFSKRKVEAPVHMCMFENTASIYYLWRIERYLLDEKTHSKFTTLCGNIFSSSAVIMMMLGTKKTRGGYKHLGNAWLCQRSIAPYRTLLTRLMGNFQLCSLKQSLF